MFTSVWDAFRIDSQGRRPNSQIFAKTQLRGVASRRIVSDRMAIGWITNCQLVSCQQHFRFFAVAIWIIVKLLVLSELLADFISRDNLWERHSLTEKSLFAETNGRGFSSCICYLPDDNDLHSTFTHRRSSPNGLEVKCAKLRVEKEFLITHQINMIFWRKRYKKKIVWSLAFQSTLSQTHKRSLNEAKTSQNMCEQRLYYPDELE